MPVVSRSVMIIPVPHSLNFKLKHYRVFVYIHMKKRNRYYVALYCVQIYDVDVNISDANIKMFE